MGTFYILLIVSVLELLETGVNCYDPCETAIEIHDPFRSTKHKLKRGDKAICDYKLDRDWYKFKGGLQIPTTKPKPLHCGTLAPIWMRRTPPTTIGEVVETEACINLFNINKGCAKKLPLSVKYCKGNFYVYRLTPPRGCSMAYCAGDRTPCPKGQEGIYPDCKVSNMTDFPVNLLPSPTVTYRKDQPLYTRQEMICGFDFPVWNNVSYLVEWYGKHVKPVKRDMWCVPEETKDDKNICSRRKSTITLTTHYRIGDSVRCRLFMKYSTSRKNKWTEFGRDSNLFYVGIEVTPRHVIVTECKTAVNITVNLRPTIPISWSKNVYKLYQTNETEGSERKKRNTQLASVVVMVLIPEKYKNKRRQAAVDKCNVKLTSQDVDRGKDITVIGICDNQKEERDTYAFHFRPETTLPEWLPGIYRMPSTQVSVDNTETRMCSATTDPNFTPFDHQHFSHNEPGDYVMHINEAKKIEVHIRLWMCGRRGSCVCGVAVREGKDVIVLSICNDVRIFEKPVRTILRTVKRSPGSLSKGIHVLKKIAGLSSTYFEVILKSGTRIEVKRRTETLNVYINAPGTEKGKVAGICGNFNDDVTDDFSQGGDGKAHKNAKEFIESWKLTEDRSLFDMKIKPEIQNEQEEGRSCYCPTEKGQNIIKDCQDNANHFTKFDKETTEIVLQYGISSKRWVESDWYSDDIIDHVDRSYFVDDPQVQHAMNRIRSKRSPRVEMSKDEATKYCRRIIEESQAGKACKELEVESIESALVQCTTDLEISGDVSFAALAFDTLQYVCEDSILKNMSLYSESSTGDLVPPREVVANVCPGDCSGHGRCKNKTCVCDEGRTALDCSMDVNAVPELLGIYNGGLCDIRERPCKKTNLLGDNFINSNNLTCHVKEFKVYPTEFWSPRGIPKKLNGTMIDIFGLKCDLPDPPTRLGDYDHEGTPAGGLLISVSNDGFNASVQKLRHVSFDSKCMNCSNSSICERKPNSCLIRGHCFAANEPNPRDWCQQCLPRDDQNSWTRRKNNQAPKFTTKTTMFAVQEEYLVLQLRASDPDNRPVTYSLLSSTATGHTLSTAGLLRLKVTSNEKFNFKVTDECGAFDITDMRVRIVQCPCLNGGQCVPHPYHPRGSGLYQCKCKEKFSGKHCELCKGVRNNKPPKFTSQTSINALQGEDLSIQLKAEDPEKMNITYSLLSSTATGHTLSSSGLLRWKATSNSSFTIKLTDECDTFDTIEVTLRIVQCPCFNGGKCVPHPKHPRGSGKYMCKCVNRFQGERCERCPGFVCPPRNVTVKAIGSTKLEVNWLGPSDNLISYYYVKYAQLKYKYRWEQVPKTITTKTLNYLKKFTDYRVAVSVVNGHKEKMVETMAKTGEDVPDAAPVITAISPKRYDEMFVRWSKIPKDKRNGIILGYKIYYRKLYTEDAWNTTTTSTGDSTSTTVTGLQSYTEYCVKMSAFTSKGEYPHWKRRHCYQVKTPSLPIKVSGEGISSREIRLRFEKPKRSMPSNRIQVDYGKQKDRLNTKKACYGSSCVIDNLEPDTMYYFKVIGYAYQRGESPSFTQIRTLARGESATP